MALPTVDLLTSAADVKLAVGIGVGGATDTTEDTMLDALVGQVSALITESFGKSFLLASNAANPITEFYSGNGRQQMNLRHWPIQGPTYTGTTTSGSTSITGLSGTKYLFINQSVNGANLQGGTYITNISGTTLTINLPAAISGSGPLSFGLAVWQDDLAYYGDAPNAFAAVTILSPGVDYALRRDQVDGSSRSGQLIRINDVWRPKWQRDQNMLSSMPVPGWGNIKVQYVGGWDLLPLDISMAAIRACAKVRNSKWWGDTVQSESYEDQNYQLPPIPKGVWLGILAGDVAPMVARYRRLRQGE